MGGTNNLKIFKYDEMFLVEFLHLLSNLDRRKYLPIKSQKYFFVPSKLSITMHTQIRVWIIFLVDKPVAHHVRTIRLFILILSINVIAAGRAIRYTTKVTTV